MATSLSNSRLIEDPTYLDRTYVSSERLGDKMIPWSHYRMEMAEDFQEYQQRLTVARNLIRSDQVQDLCSKSFFNLTDIGRGAGRANEGFPPWFVRHYFPSIQSADEKRKLFARVAKASISPKVRKLVQAWSKNAPTIASCERQAAHHLREEGESNLQIIALKVAEVRKRKLGFNWVMRKEQEIEEILAAPLPPEVGSKRGATHLEEEEAQAAKRPCFDENLEREEALLLDFGRSASEEGTAASFSAVPDPNFWQQRQGADDGSASIEGALLDGSYSSLPWAYDFSSLYEPGEFDGEIDLGEADWLRRVMREHSVQ